MSKWLGNDNTAKKEMVFSLFDKAPDKIAGLTEVWQFVRVAEVPVADIGNILFWLLEERGVTEKDLNTLDSSIRGE